MAQPDYTRPQGDRILSADAPVNLLEICHDFRKTTAIIGDRVSTVLFAVDTPGKRKHVDDQTPKARLPTGKETTPVGRVARM